MIINHSADERDRAPEQGEIIRQVEIPLSPETRQAVAAGLLPQLEQMRDLTLRQGREYAQLQGVKPNIYTHSAEPAGSPIVPGQKTFMDRESMRELYATMETAGNVPLVLTHTHPNGVTDFSSPDKTTWVKPPEATVFMANDVWEIADWRPVFCVLGVSQLEEENMVVFLTQNQEQVDVDELMTGNIFHRLQIIMELTKPNPQFTPEMEAEALRIEEAMGYDGEAEEGKEEGFITPEESERYWDEARLWLQEIGFTLQRFQLSHAEAITGYLADHLPEKLVLIQRKEKPLPLPDLSLLRKRR